MAKAEQTLPLSNPGPMIRVGDEVPLERFHRTARTGLEERDLSAAVEAIMGRSLPEIVADRLEFVCADYGRRDLSRELILACLPFALHPALEALLRSDRSTDWLMQVKEEVNKEAGLFRSPNAKNRYADFQLLRKSGAFADIDTESQAFSLGEDIYTEQADVSGFRAHTPSLVDSLGYNEYRVDVEDWEFAVYGAILYQAVQRRPELIVPNQGRFLELDYTLCRASMEFYNQLDIAVAEALIQAAKENPTITESEIGKDTFPNIDARPIFKKVIASMPLADEEISEAKLASMFSRPVDSL